MSLPSGLKVTQSDGSVKPSRLADKAGYQALGILWLLFFIGKYDLPKILFSSADRSDQLVDVFR